MDIAPSDVERFEPYSVNSKNLEQDMFLTKRLDCWNGKGAHASAPCFPCLPITRSPDPKFTF